MSSPFSKVWIPLLLLLVVSLMAGAAYFIFSDSETDALVEKFAEEASEEAARAASASKAPPASDGAEFAKHAVEVGLYTKIYAAFDAEIGGAANGEAVAEVAEAYRTGRVALDGLRAHIRSRGAAHWRREGDGGINSKSNSNSNSKSKSSPSVSEHISALAESLGESLPTGGEAMSAIESAVSQGLVSMRHIWERINAFKEGFEEEGVAGAAQPSAPSSSGTVPTPPTQSPAQSPAQSPPPEPAAINPSASGQAPPTPAAPSPTAPSPTAPTPAAPSQTSPSQTSPTPAAPSQTAPSPTAPSQTAPSPTAPSQTSPAPTAPTPTAPSQTASAPGSASPAPSADGNVRTPVNSPDDFRRADGTFDLQGFDRTFADTSKGSDPSNGPPRLPEQAKLGAVGFGAPPGPPVPDRDALLEEGVSKATGVGAETFRKADGTFDTAAFNAGFKRLLEEGRASRAGSLDAFGDASGPPGSLASAKAGVPPAGISPVGARERDDGKAGSSWAKVGGSSAAAKDFMASVSEAEGMAERREPYRVFPFPHAPAFVPARFSDDTESLDARVSAVYRTVFGDPPDPPTRKFLSGRLRAWGGDTRRLSNLVSTMHTLASAESRRRKTARDAALAEVVKALSEGVAESDARAAADRKMKEASEAEAKINSELLSMSPDPAQPGAPRLGEKAVFEIAGVTSSLLSQMEGGGATPEEAEKDVRTSLMDWRDAQIAIAEARNAPVTQADSYTEARDHGALVASRHFQNPAVGM